MIGLVLATDPSGAPYLAGIVAGFALGAFGQLIALRVLVALGIVVVLVTTILFILATDPTSGSY